MVNEQVAKASRELKAWATLTSARVPDPNRDGEGFEYDSRACVHAQQLWPKKPPKA